MKKAVMLALMGMLALPAWGASTRENRDESLLFVGVSPLGLHVPTLVTTPVGLGVYLGEDWMIGGEYGQRTFEEDEDGAEGEGTYRNAGGYVRWFPGTNSFNVGLAVHERTLDADATATVDDPTFGTVDVAASLDTKATVGSLILGNQWMMDFGLVLALDWVVLSGPLSTSVDTSFTGTATQPDGTPVPLSSLDPQTVEEAERDLEDTGELVNQVSSLPGLFVFTIGWAF